MNSDKELDIGNNDDATNPKSTFTFIIGGNIVSRGVTFNNLLSMFFTRDAKHKLTQDTYIQRARMFGVRGEYMKYFELCIPEQLYEDWCRMFLFHKLSLESRKKEGVPTVWLADKRIQPTSPASINKATVNPDRGEMTFSVFNYALHEKAIGDIWKENIEIIDLFKLKDIVGSQSLPEYIIDFIKNSSSYTSNGLKLLEPNSIEKMSDADQETIIRCKGFIGKYKKYLEQGAEHLLTIRHNYDKTKARFVYRHIGSISFLKVKSN